MSPYSGTHIKAAEETEERTVTRGADDLDPNAPDYRNASYREQIKDVKLVRAVFGGTKTMRAKGEAFLPRHPMEKRKKYSDRLKQAVAFNAFKRTVRGLTGMIFRRDPTLEDLDEAVEEHLTNIDRRGSAFPVFARRVAENAMIDGHSWIFVDAPKVDPEVIRNQAESEAAGVRPYWVEITKEEAINWRFVIRDGEPVLTLFAYREGKTEADGDFGERSVSRVRVLREIGEIGSTQVQVEVWELVERENEANRWEMVDAESGIVDIPRIPVVAAMGNETALFESEPPLLDLAFEQIEHYRVRSDRQRSMTFASIAVPYLFGEGVFDEDGNPKVTWGPEGMMLLNDPEAQTGMVESHGFGLDATKEELGEIEARMAALGLQMLVRESRAAETAEAKLLDKSESDAALAIFARSIENAMNEALELHGLYRNEDEPGKARLNRDYQTQLMDPGMVRELNALVAAGNLSLDTMWWILVQGELLPEGFDPEEERTKIMEDGSLGLETVEREMFGDGQDGADSVDRLAQQFEELERRVAAREEQETAA